VLGSDVVPEDIVLPFPARIEPVREVRSTVIISSIGVLRGAGHFERYAAALSPDARELLVNAVAGAWFPIDLALVHYGACDALQLSGEQMAAFGRAVFDKTRGTLLGTMVRMAREVGASPWTVMPSLQRFWDRAYRGGGIRIVKTGPKEARGEVIQARMCDSLYYRHALRGLLAGVVELFSQKAYVSVLPDHRPGGVSYRIQWV
jgi:hypothetical protein